MRDADPDTLPLSADILEIWLREAIHAGQTASQQLEESRRLAASLWRRLPPAVREQVAEEGDGWLPEASPEQP